MSGSWIVLGLIAALGGAGVAVLGKVGLGSVDPTLATTLRSIVMTLTLLGVAAAGGQLRGLTSNALAVDGRAWMFIILAGLSGAISWLAYFAALRLGTATQVASIDRLSLAFVAVLAALFLGERFGVRGWTGVVMVVLGIVLVASDSTGPTAGEAAPCRERGSGPDGPSALESPGGGEDGNGRDQAGTSIVRTGTRRISLKVRPSNTKVR